jgi:chemotaxis protein MotA
MRNLCRSCLAAFLRAPALGAAGGFLVILGAVMLGTHNLLAFFSIEGLVIVVGGVIAVAYMSFDAEDVRAALNLVRAMFRERNAPAQDNLHHDMMEIIAWAYLAREKGMRRLEASLAKRGIADPFVKYGLNMVVSGYAPEEVRAMMETAADASYDRDSIPLEVLHSMASHAPAFGMIGTLLGMVAMLCSLGDGVAGIGSSLYGVVSARMAYLPAAAKLRQNVARRRFRNQLITEGMVMLVSEKTPMYIKDRLNSFLRPERHDYIDQFKLEPRLAPRAPHLKVIGA